MNSRVFITSFLTIVAFGSVIGGGVGAVALFPNWLGAVLALLWVALGLSAILAWAENQ